ncbi:hypothetical protein [Hymenobacter aerophilus]|uniref:hypothetical protein n=1 Tax=Hymenobacter aerophilus TaxID=119644 RepID=UPI00037F4252|nr:hypothetical protein [Hymenobacter aerophilus]
MHLRTVRTAAYLGGGLLLALLTAPRAQAQDRPQARPATQPRTPDQSRASNEPRSQVQRKPARPGISSDQPSYRKEFTYGINFNTRGGLIGGVSVRSTRLLTQDWARFWSIEAVEIKHPKESKQVTEYGGTYVRGKTNYLFALRPSFGVQRVVFRKAPEAGVQVNALLSGGPSIGLLMPYYIGYNYADRQSGVLDVRNEQYDPAKHGESGIYDRAPLFSGAGDTKPIIGAHVRGGLDFEFGRYRDAVAGAEVGVLLEAYTKTPIIIRNSVLTPDKSINDQFLPSVYLTIYLGNRN